MSLSDPIADMLTRIRNASRVHRKQVNVRASKICEGIANVLRDEGYIADYAKVEEANKQGVLRIDLKYGNLGEEVIQFIRRESKPGRRVYCRVENLPTVLGGMGIAVVSTNKGVLSDKRCREENVGGELLCTVY